MKGGPREDDRAKLLGSVGLNSLGDIYSVFPPKAREFSEGVFGRLKEILSKSPHAAFLRELLTEEETLPTHPVLWNNPYGLYLAGQLDRLQYEFSDELLESQTLLDLAFELQTFLCEELHTETAGFSYSSGFSALMEAVRLTLTKPSCKPDAAVALPETLPLTWRQALNRNYPGTPFLLAPLAVDGSLCWNELHADAARIALVVTVLDSAKPDPAPIQALFTEAVWAEVILDPLTLYADCPTAATPDFRVLELEEILSVQRHVTGLSAGVLAGKRSLFSGAETWLVGNSKTNHRKTWFQPSTGSTAPLPRFLPLESLKAILLWRVHERTELVAAWQRAHAHFQYLTEELVKMGVPAVVTFPNGRQGAFKVPKAQPRRERAVQHRWNDIAFAEMVWGTGKDGALVSSLWLRVGPECSQTQVKQLLEDLTHDGT